MIEEYLTGEAFEKRVAKCERHAADDPAAYRRRVLTMAWLGYWLVPVIMVVLLIPPAYVFWRIFAGDWSLTKQIFYGAMWGFYALGVGQMSFALFVPHHPVEGLDVTAADAPELAGVIAEVREKLAAPKLDRVVLVDELNAAAAQVPKRSFMKKTTNELVLGLPLLQSLERDELRAVIAHEFGHFTGDHGSDGFLVARTIRAWDIALESSESYAFAGILPLAVAKWFVPRFMAYSFALRRDNEFFSDRAAVAVCGVETVGRALVRIELASNHAQACKEDYLKSALQSDDPPKEPLKLVYGDLANASSSRSARGHLLIELFAESDPLDTHPGLRTRLAAIGADEAVPAPVAKPATSLLGDFAATAYSHFNAELHERIAEDWPSAHEDYMRDKAKFETLHAKAKGEKLTLDDALERARLSETFGADGDRPLCHNDAVEWYPDQARAVYAMGCFMAEDHDMRAVEYLQKASSLDDTATGAVLMTEARLAAVGNDAETVIANRRKANEWFEANNDRLYKMQEPSPGGELRGLDDNYDPEGFIETMRDNEIMFGRAYLAIRPLPEWLDERLWLIVEPRAYGHAHSPEELSGEIYESADAFGMSLNFRIWVLEKGEDWLFAQVATVPNALIWTHGDAVAADDAAKDAA